MLIINYSQFQHAMAHIGRINDIRNHAFGTINIEILELDQAGNCLKSQSGQPVVYNYQIENVNVNQFQNHKLRNALGAVSCLGADSQSGNFDLAQLIGMDCLFFIHRLIYNGGRSSRDVLYDILPLQMIQYPWINDEGDSHEEK